MSNVEVIKDVLNVLRDTDCQKAIDVIIGVDTDYITQKLEEHEKIEMIDYDGTQYVPKDLCTIGADGFADDVTPCGDCSQEMCENCIVAKVFNEYARVSGQTN